MGPFGARVSPITPTVGVLGQNIPSRAAIVPFLHDTARDRDQVAVTTQLASIYQVIDPPIGVGPTKQRGRVSIERMLALRDYTKRTSTTRAIVVCLLTPVPALVLVATIESLPLASPSLCWHEQAVFCVRMFLVTMVIELGFCVSFKQLTCRALEISFGQMIAFSVLSSALYTCSIVGLAAVWTFPVPFLFMIGGIPLILCQIIASLAVINVRGVITKLKGLQKRMGGICFVSSAIYLFYWIYPLCSVAYEYVGPKYQVALLLILPIFKGHWKQHVCRRLAEVEDLIPTLMMFTIELFNSLYLATCMQLSRSPLVNAAIILLDVVQGFVRVRRVHARKAVLLATIKAATNVRGDRELFRWFLDRVQDDSVTRLNGGLLATARIRGNGLEHSLTEMTATTLRALDAARQSRADRIQSMYALPTDDTALNQTLEFLFHCEFMVLAEYIECAIPMLYAVYLPILRSLPNAAYYGHVHALSIDGLRYAELNILVYWLFQLGSLVAIVLWLRRQFGLSVLHVLAFVLEDQVTFVQANVIFQIMVALPFTLAHNGADFSFKFAWIKDPSVTWWVKT